MKHLLITAGLLLPLILSAQEYVEFSAEEPSSGTRHALSIIGIVASFLLVKYREQMGNMIGEADWMQKVGGIYNVIVIFAIFLFFWSLSALTGTTNIFLKPLSLILPSSSQDPNPF